MKISMKKTGNHLIIKVIGRIDAHTSISFRDYVLDAIKNEKRDLVIDLSEVGYISSAGLRALFMIDEKTRGKGKKCSLCSVAPEVYSVIKMTGVVDIFRIYPSLDAVINGNE